MTIMFLGMSSYMGGASPSRIRGMMKAEGALLSWEALMVATMPSMHDSKQLVQLSTTRSTQGTVVCTICSAQYAPTQAHAYLANAPQLAVESAFMSMCHFCFRCRRPACPLCWDNVHGLCGACVEDVHLPFRQDAEPLPFNSALLVPTSSRSQQQLVSSFPLVCIQPGRFQADVPVIEQFDTPEPATVVAPTPDVQQQQKVLEMSAQDNVVPIAVQERKNVGSIARRIERIMTLVLGVILFIIAVLIVAVSFSEQANEAIVHVLHVDIRMEIEYLLQLIQQLHSGG